jgi:hypothetical protein
LSIASRVVVGGVDAGLDRVLLGGQPERVPAHRVQDVEPLHALVAQMMSVAV